MIPAWLPRWWCFVFGHATIDVTRHLAADHPERLFTFGCTRCYVVFYVTKAGAFKS